MGLTFFNAVVSAAHRIHLLEFTTEDEEVTRGALSARSNAMDRVDGVDQFQNGCRHGHRILPENCDL